MGTIRTEKLRCHSCGEKLDVPVYETGCVIRYGMYYCYQCGRFLFEWEEPVKPPDWNCKLCGTPISEGAEYYDINGTKLCRVCMEIRGAEYLRIRGDKEYSEKQAER